MPGLRVRLRLRSGADFRDGSFWGVRGQMSYIPAIYCADTDILLSRFIAPQRSSVLLLLSVCPSVCLPGGHTVFKTIEVLIKQ